MEERKLRLKIDVDFNEDEIDDMVDGLKGLIKVLLVQLKENAPDKNISLVLPLGTISIHIQ